MNFSLICISSIDNSFIKGKEYKVEDGYLYTEQDISINTNIYKNSLEAIEDLKTKGYSFKEKEVTNSAAFNSHFTMNDVFGDIFSMYENNTNKDDINQKRQDAENLKNNILSQILKGNY